MSLPSYLAAPDPSTVQRGAAPLFSEPTRRIRGGWMTTFGLAWLGVWVAQLTPVQLQLPAQVNALIGDTTWDQKVLQFGIVSGVSAAFAVIAYPLAGALSDRTTSRFGRRRPWILGGALLFAAALVVLGLQDTFLGVTIWWSVAMIGFCSLSAGLTAVIADQVPTDQRGVASSLMSIPQGLGVILGVALIGGLVASLFLGYVICAIVVVALVVPFVILVPDATMRKEQRPRFDLVTLLRGFWISPRRYPDFAWTLTSRVLVNIANVLGTGLLLDYLIFGLGQDEAAAADNLLTVILVYTVASTVASIVCGRLSDRLGRRKVFVGVSAAIQAVGALTVVTFPSFETVVVVGGVLGVGYGCFLSVDQALATQVLPDAHSRGKDLGVMNIASTVPQAVGPMIGALIITALADIGPLESFGATFYLSAILATLGAIAVIPVRRVR